MCDCDAPMSAARRKIDLAAVGERCQSLGLAHAVECLAELVEEASREKLKPVRSSPRCLGARSSARTNGASPVYRDSPGCQPARPPSASTGVPVHRCRFTLDAGHCAFIRETDTVLLDGPTEPGKAHLALALGVKAIKNGSQQHPAPLPEELMHELEEDAATSLRRLDAHEVTASLPTRQCRRGPQTGSHVPEVR